MARLRRRVLIILAIVVLIYCIADMVSFLRTMNNEKRLPTLKRFLPFAKEIGSDNELYERHPDYLYPPVFLVLMKPLTWVPASAAAALWQLAKYVCIVIAFGASWRMFTSSAGPPADWSKLASIIVSARFVHSDLRHGNINLFIAALVIGAGWCLVTERRFLCGFLIAVAACIKVTPGLWGLYLLYRRDWRALAGCAIGAALFFELIPSAALGFEMNHTLLDRWRAHVIDAFVGDGDVDSVGMNQSLTAVTNRLLGHTSVLPEDRVNLAELDDDVIQYIQRLLSVFILLITAFAVRPRENQYAIATAADWAILAPVSLALSGITWTGHFCLLIPAYAAFFGFVAGTSLRKPMDRLFVGLGVGSVCLVLLTGDLLTESGREFTARIGMPLISALMLLSALIHIRKRWAGNAGAETGAGQHESIRV